jgi:hypothetical protein
MSLTAHDTAAVLGLKPNSFERWEFVNLELADYSIGTSELRALAWVETDDEDAIGDTPCIAAVLLGNVWHEPSAIFRECVIRVWEAEAREQFRAADREWAEDLQLAIAGVE